MRILMVEDEKYIAKAVAEVLKKNHYTVDLAYDGESGLDGILSGIYDMIILDIMLPKKDGLSVLREARSSGIKTPVILLTARGQLEDKVKGLDDGADDYLAKPFHTEELLARLRALSRRKPEMDIDGVLVFEDIQLIPRFLLLRANGRECKLTLKEAQLLELLIAHQSQVMSKEMIIEKIWGYDGIAEDNHVEVHISLVRKKLASLNAQAGIRTIRGIGYTMFGRGVE